AFQQRIYVGACLLPPASLSRGRTDPKAGSRRRSFWTVGTLVVAVAVSLSAKLYATLTCAFDELWASSSLILGAVLVVVVILPLSGEDWNKAFRGASAIQERVTAIYMFYRTGEPLVALASSRHLPIGAEQPEGLL